MIRAILTGTAAAAALILAIACSDDDSAGDGTGGAAANSGAGVGNGGTGGTGIGSSGSGGGVTLPPPEPDPNTGKWMCSAPDGTKHVCECNDDIDNDGDQVIDILDPNCVGTPNSDSEAGTGPGGMCGTTQCSNCQDDDGDGLSDSADPECTGSLDNLEDSFATGIPGDNVDACKQDCFFDGNSGEGNDGCDWQLKCDPANPGAQIGCPYDENYSNCPTEQSDKCLNTCRKYTPNGCDCFGCCSVFVDGTEHVVKLLNTCSVEKIGDPAACPVCTKVEACNNDCGECEYCLGKEPPASCAPVQNPPDAGTPPPDAGPPPVEGQCPVGVTPCIPGAGATCPAGTYCTTGCCVPSIE